MKCLASFKKKKERTTFTLKPKTAQFNCDKWKYMVYVNTPAQQHYHKSNLKWTKYQKSIHIIIQRE